jgi:hypothetical protein
MSKEEEEIAKSIISQEIHLTLLKLKKMDVLHVMSYLL